MRTTARSIRTTAILALLAVIVLTIYFWNNGVRNSAPAPTPPATVAATHLPAPAPLPVALAPQPPPPAKLMPGGNAPSGDNPTPDPTPTDLKDAVADFNRLIQAEDIPTFVQRYANPGEIPATSEDLPRLLSDTSRLGQARIARFKNAIQLLTNETPTMSADGNKATYIDRSIYTAETPPLSPQGMANLTPEAIDSLDSIQIVFVRDDNGQWHLDHSIMGTLWAAILNSTP